MFNNQRFVTCGIADELSPELQAFLWKLIKEMEVTEQDYLQVFDLSCCGNEQIIVHEQEQPEYKKEHRLEIVGTPIFVGKIFVIDDGDHTTMMKSDEY